MYETLLIVPLLFCLPLFLRGGAFHNHMVHEAESTFRKLGFATWLEHGIRLPDGRLDFVDLLVHRGNCILCVEIETTCRNILQTATKADSLGLPLWIIVPNRKTRDSVNRKLERVPVRPGGLKIYVLLLNQLNQILTKYCPQNSPVNGTRGNRKTKKREI